MNRILITGSTGHLGKGTIRNLLKHVSPNNIVAFARDIEKAKDLIRDNIEVRQGDFDDLASLDHAMQGINKVLLISGMDTNRLQQHKNVIDAAKRAKVKHIIYTGVALKSKDGTALKDFMGGHFDTEDYIIESGIDYTFMRNSLYAELLPDFTGEKPVENGIFLPTGDGKVPFAFRREIAEATANVLINNDHINKIYEITGDESYSYQTLADELSSLSGKEVKYTNVNEITYINSLKEAGVNKHYIEILSGFAADIKNHQYEIQSKDLAMLLGRKPMSVREKLKETYFL